jgi:hypothetical protein
MIITKVEFLPSNMRQEDPNWRYSLRASKVSQGWIEFLQTEEGLTGYG